MKQNRLHDFIIIDIWSLITVLNNVSYRLVDEETKINNIWLTSSLVAYGIAIKVAMLSVWNFRPLFLHTLRFGVSMVFLPDKQKQSKLGIWVKRFEALSSSKFCTNALSQALFSWPSCHFRISIYGPHAMTYERAKRLTDSKGIKCSLID